MHNHPNDAARPRESSMNNKVANCSESKTAEVFPSGTGWKVLMVKHPQTGLYYAAGINLGQ
jgi:hypothetical protein